jgi:hypothetical protein
LRLQRRRRAIAAGALLSLLLPACAAAADSSCDEASARDRLAVLKDALQRPESLAAMDAAKADFAADGKFDNVKDAHVLAAAAVYFKVERELDAGSVDDACAFLAQAKPLIDEVLGRK